MTSFRSLSLTLLTTIGLAASPIAYGQSLSLEKTGDPADVELDNRTEAFSIDLSQFFEVPGVEENIVLINTDLGTIPVELLPEAAPNTVANFYTYVDENAYDKGFFHRSVKDFIIQAGGFYFDDEDTFYSIETRDPIELEYNLPNTRGTIAMARTNEPDSATSGWFINTVDNTEDLGESNGGGYAVFARVIGSGLEVVDALAELPVYNMSYYWGSAFQNFPSEEVLNSISDLGVEEFVSIPSITRASILPDPDSEFSFVSISSVVSSDPDIAGISDSSLVGSNLVLGLGLGETGSTDITVTVQDTNENEIQLAFTITLVESFVTPDIAEKTVAQGASDYDIAVDSNTTWLAASQESWITLSETSFDGPATLTVSVQENSLDTPRVGVILIDGAPHYVYQEGDYDAWLSNYFTAEQISGMSPSPALADSDRDGLSNQLEHALSTDPSKATSKIETYISLESGQPQIVFAPYAKGLEFTLYSSSDLKRWAPVSLGEGAAFEDSVPSIAFPLPEGDHPFFQFELSGRLLTAIGD
ncbi:peptidylprolyl isomerase [Pelagicoccus sp. SDUM812003]|uniref:peptidylprolyl isomerase n=1 Tax=Pelagicoccus sp. SDUM812003 TaxID=3041267 RepID=UPI00280CEB89|nr:peptidylprolyl isomerase [Pelagicoccus sp. SDUM812003]MDQ8202353.1 peptidylprolyl isomerase [Pelagicoccus sp. SDUM812003]